MDELAPACRRADGVTTNRIVLADPTSAKEYHYKVIATGADSKLITITCIVVLPFPKHETMDSVSGRHRPLGDFNSTAFFVGCG